MKYVHYCPIQLDKFLHLVTIIYFKAATYLVDTLFLLCNSKNNKFLYFYIFTLRIFGKFFSEKCPFKICHVASHQLPKLGQNRFYLTYLFHEICKI